MIVAAVVAVCTSRMDALAWLYKAQSRSTLELSVIDQAKGFWKEARYHQLCLHEAPETERYVQIGQESVRLELLDTAVRCQSSYGTATIFIDDGGITVLEWE